MHMALSSAVNISFIPKVSIIYTDPAWGVGVVCVCVGVCVCVCVWGGCVCGGGACVCV